MQVDFGKAEPSAVLVTPCFVGRGDVHKSLYPRHPQFSPYFSLLCIIKSAKPRFLPHWLLARGIHRDVK
jgi:hypothetical protein